MKRSQCPHLFTTARGSNQWQCRKTCKLCGALLQVERRSERGSLDRAESEEAFSQGTMQTDAAAEEKWSKLEPTPEPLEAKWSKLAYAYAAHARAMARAEAGRTRRQLEVTPCSSLLREAWARQRRQIMLVLSAFCLLFFARKTLR